MAQRLVEDKVGSVTFREIAKQQKNHFFQEKAKRGDRRFLIVTV